MKKRFLLFFFTSICTYSFIFQISSYFKHEASQADIALPSKDTVNNAEKIAKNLEQGNLAFNFLANKTQLSKEELKKFQSSGTVHLLAVSGGQIAPLIFLIEFVLIAFLSFILSPFLNSFAMVLWIGSLKIVIQSLVSFFICIKFGFTGALLRVWGLSYLRNMSWLRKFYVFIYSKTYFFNNITFSRSFALCILISIFGDLSCNFSFLLSALGATMLEISWRVLHAIKKQKDWYFLYHYIYLTVLTSMLTSLFLKPIIPMNIVDAISANLLAQPLVTFLITPLSLFMTFFQSFSHPMLNTIFDTSLTALNSIASSFFDVNSQDDKENFFTLYNAYYLQFLLIFIWSLMDSIKIFFRDSSLESLKSQFLKLKTLFGRK
jgi:hypothetical protein